MVRLKTLALSALATAALSMTTAVSTATAFAPP